MCSQNAANAISGIQILKFSGGGMPPNPPRILMPSSPPPQYFIKCLLLLQTLYVLAALCGTFSLEGARLSGVYSVEPVVLMS
jgi:hypothetical protein